VPLLPVSSTDIRQRVRSGMSIHDLVPESIIPDVCQLYGCVKYPENTSFASLF